MDVVEIPDDIKNTVAGILDRCTPKSSYGLCSSYDAEIANAILAERNRCAALVRHRRPHREGTAMAIIRGEFP